ncbi:membrane protein DedA with SNARE-associated domain [Okibacterium sp. HSC-33S16]|uniref:DedA family protein n=1 Tax=Okibacterium sp. HSC-33S16 TaxID=2910965 RepID=UPI0020A0D136|nr:DedA family protein [Okibacterium sp. HSC-33S16]MCP2032525.1 membrane protein DedA with SNARE-associated domain [Okibacterium sp. HSC-33S16]
MHSIDQAGYLFAAADSSSASFADGVAQWAISLMETLGPIGAGLIVFLENVFPPIPSEVILPLAGFTASQGTFSVVEAIAWTTLGSILGAFLLYGLGRWLGHDRTVWLAARIPFVDPDDIVRTVEWFNRHGKVAVFFGRMLPIFRSLISIPAGIEKMNLGVFGVLTALGSLIWNSIFVIAGFLLGENWSAVLEYADILKYVVVAGVAVLVVWWVVRTVQRYRARRRALESEDVRTPVESGQSQRR